MKHLHIITLFEPHNRANMFVLILVLLMRMLRLREVAEPGLNWDSLTESPVLFAQALPGMPDHPGLASPAPHMKSPQRLLLQW